jgi:hypothetical protein
MGRPRKRRRDGEADEPTESSVEGHSQYVNIMHDYSQAPNFIDQISPSPLQDANSSAGSAGHEAVTPAYPSFGFSDSFSVLPDSNIEYGSLFQHCKYVLTVFQLHIGSTNRPFIVGLTV